MSGAQSWSVKGIDPKVREAVREAAARQGMTLGEYLSQALQTHQGGGAPSAPGPVHSFTGSRTRAGRLGVPATFDDNGEEEDWNVSGPSPMRATDPVRLSQRIETIERRTQLAVTGLDRAVSTIDRSVLGLAARIEDAEAASNESAERIAEAIEHFRIAGETLSGRLQQAEQEASESRDALGEARQEMSGAKERLESQVALADEVARRAEAAAAYLTTELESREAATREALSENLNQARTIAEEAARQASSASADAVAELRQLQESLSDRLAESENSTRRAVESAIEEVRTDIGERASQGARETLLQEVARLETEISHRLAAAEQLKSEQAGLVSRIERAEAGAREATAGLRQAAGAAIADLRNSQLTISARLKSIEENGGGSVDLSDVRQTQQDIAERLAALETKTEQSPVADALASFEQRIADIENNGAVQTLDDSLQRLAQRLAETESTANTAIRKLEETVSALGARVEDDGNDETEALRAMLEQRLDSMAQSVQEMVGQAQAELQDQVQAALQGGQDNGLEDAISDVNRRLASAERRQAQTIEAISLEIKRMSETVDKRLRAVEARNDDAAAAAVREELSHMSSSLEARFDEIERREAAAFDRMGLEVGRLSERLEERVGAVETRSAQAIEHVGEQVARMAERFNQRHEMLARDLGERMIDSEERSGARVSEAISSIMARLAEVEESSAEALAPMQKAVSSVASKLEAYESGQAAAPEEIPVTPQRRADDVNDFADFGENAEPYVSPMDAAQPLRAAPLPPSTPEPQATSNNDDEELDIYFTEEPEEAVEAPPVAESFEAPPMPSVVAQADDLLIDDAEDIDAFARPPEDDDPFWAPENETAQPEQPQEAATSDYAVDDDLDISEPTLDLTAPTEDAPAPQMQAAAPADETAPELEQPPGKNDYLANARRAAQAQSAPNAKSEKPAKNASAAKLRGPSRVVLWGVSGAIALMLAGGAWYAQQGSEPAPGEPQTAPEPEHVLAPSAEAIDPFAAPVDGAIDPFADPMLDTEAGAEPTEPLPEGADAPVAQAAPGQQQAAVAGPLPTRSVSLEQAAQSGNLIAQYELALQRIAAGRTEAGVQMLRGAADRGMIMAQYRLAKIYERGEGVPTDLNAARQWTERAAAGGNRRAMHDLGVYFARGEGAPQDEAAAFRWFRQAAELGVADSQYNLGVLYQQGRGVNGNPAEALFWFSVAARQGDQDAAARATALETELSQSQVEQARARAQAFRPRAAIAVANGNFGPRPWATRSGA